MAAAAFRDLDPEAKEEAVQNTLALAWKSFRALILQGRAGEAGILRSVLWYSIRQTRVGRMLRASDNTKHKDVFVNAKRGRVKFIRSELNHFVSDDTPIPDAVSFRMDVPTFLATLTDRQHRMAEDLMTGETTSTVAEVYGVTPGAVSQFRTRFKKLLLAFMAE